MDPYAVLGVPRGASRCETARAYRRLAKRHHPDVNADPAAADRMQRINAAWRALSDLGTRAQHWAGTTSSGHWTAAGATGRRGSRASESWATWGPRSGGTAGPRPRWSSSCPHIRRTNRPPRTVRADVPFQDTGLAALLAAGLIVLLLFAAAYVGSVSASPA